MKKQLFRRYLDSFRLASTHEGTEFLSLVSDLIERPEVAKLDGIRHHYSVSRLQHAKSVAYLSYLHCRRRGLAAEEVARAALLHDLFYQHSHSEEKPRLLLCRHPAIALENARALTPLTKTGEDVIARHMFPFGLPPRTREGRIVSRMDKYCAVQEFFRRIVPSFYRKRT